MGKLDGKVAVITAATTGMAFATAKRFVEEGAYVFITGRKQEKLDRAIKELGINSSGIIADSAKLSDLDHLYEQVKKIKGKIDILFASAGTAVPGVIGTITEEAFDTTFDLNVKGTLFTVQKALPLFSEGGSIILNGSIANLKGFPGSSVYAGSKGALRSFVRGWLVDLKPKNIRVNVLSPGPIDTPLIRSYGPDVTAMFQSQVPRGTLGREEEIASAALFLASTDSSFVNGSELCVDGGMAQI